MRDHLILYVNGQRHAIRGADAFRSLTDWLRYQRGLTGTKVVCAEGDCGACTVLLGRPDSGQMVYQPVDACILYLFQLDATHVVTVEGLGTPQALHPIQQAYVDGHGSQCGFCTPGFVMATAGLCEHRRQPLDDEALRLGLVGNLCRCTGYEQIVQAARTLNGCDVPRVADRYPGGALAAELSAAAAEPVMLDDLAPPLAGAEPTRRRLFKPVTLEQATQFKAESPGCMVIAGGTEWGVRLNRTHDEPPAVLTLSGVPDWSDVRVREECLEVGGGATWTSILAACRTALPEFAAIVELFGSPQIRHVGTLAGNVANGSPIADSLPLMYVLGANLELTGRAGVRRVRVDQFYTGYRQHVLQADELISRVYLPLPTANQRLKLYKVSKRRDLDISTFCAAVLLTLDGDTIEQARIAYGGVAPTVRRLPATERMLAGQPFTEQVMRQAGRLARGEIAPISDVRASRDYRLQLAENILVKCYHDLAEPVAV